MGNAEHMLFFSSEKYPDEDSYSKYLTEVYMQARSFPVVIFSTYVLLNISYLDCVLQNLFNKSSFVCSMEAIQMLSLRRSIRIITLMLVQIIWRRLWTGSAESFDERKIPCILHVLEQS